MSRLTDLKAAADLEDVARLLNFEASKLAYVLYVQPSGYKYEKFEIPKRYGGNRSICAPTKGLKIAQKKLSSLLQDSVDEINAERGVKHRIAHGFTRGLSIITNGRCHRNKRYVFNVDLKDFFPSINFGRVRGYFIRDRYFALNEKVATIFAQIACHENALPQGSPCSPVISNLIGHVLDMHLVRLAFSVGCRYSRYADDLTFSTNKPEFPPEISVKTGAQSPHEWHPGEKLLEVVKFSGFDVNPAKTRMQYRNSRQEVTGLVVNRKLNVRSEYRHTVRAMVHTLLNKGSFEILRAGEKVEGTLDQLHGMLGFIDSVDLNNEDALAKDSKRRASLEKKEITFRRFLVYKEFYASKTPVVVCEGPTDNVYLTKAICSLASDFPELATIGSDGKITLRIRLYKYRKSSTREILGLRDGGSSHLSNFMAMYRTETNRFNAPGKEHPVIILYDNDSGAKGIRNIIKQISGIGISAAQPFSHVVRNLYAMPTPLLGDREESKIEDFFDSGIKSIQLDGKTFSEDNNFNRGEHYGKQDFALRIVTPNADSIDFKGFKPLLTNLVSVIEAHAAAVVKEPAIQEA